MRKFLLLLPLLAAMGRLAQPCHAQTLEERIRTIYAPLDKSAIETGILIHQTPVFLWPGRFNGVKVADSMQLSLDQFGILYGQFRGAAVGRSTLPAPSVYISKALKPYREGDTIDLAFMAMRYDFIRVSAREDNLLEWRDGQMHDVAGRSTSPYGQDTCLSGGAIILRPGAILRLWDGQQDDGEAYLKIEGNGKLRIEGDFDLSGNGYIGLQGSISPSIYPIMEDLRTEVKFAGHAKTCRLFYLDHAGLGAVNKPFRLENMKINLNFGSMGGENSAIRVSNVSTISATGNYWEGVNNLSYDAWRLYNSALDFSPPFG